MSGIQTVTFGRRYHGNPVLRLVGLISAASLRYRHRQTLARLDDRLLRDIGLDAATAAQECAKPFWRE